MDLRAVAKMEGITSWMVPSKELQYSIHLHHRIVKDSEFAARLNVKVLTSESQTGSFHT